MVQISFLQEVSDILKIARTRALELGLDTISSELLLDSIVRHNDNSGVKLLEARGAKLSKIKANLSDRLESLRKTPIAEIIMPNFSMQLRRIVDLAGIISSNGIDAASLVHAMYRAQDSIASQILVAAEFTEIGERGRPTSEGSFSRVIPQALMQFCTDLTAMASRGQLDPVIGRQNEIQRMIEILARRKKNNPVLIGEPGIGKTSIVDGLAIRIANGQVPEILQNKQILSLDLNSVLAGTQFRGQYEKRMQMILNELEKNKDIIILIDELHTIMGSGGSEGTGDAGSILKPALSRGTIRCIGTTTLDDYRKHIEKDGALERRFQKILVESPTAEETKLILDNIKELYEAFHGIKYTPGALDSIVNLSNRYISDKNFPDKAIDVLDEVAAANRLKDNKTITEVEVQTVIARITGIPMTSLGKNERERLKTIEQDLGSKVIGQEEGIKELAYAIKRSRTGIRSEKRPASFLFLGPTGVGKTETARQLAKYLFDKDDAFIRIDMSEYGEKFSVSTLIGSPPGYIGFEQGGKLTESIRRKPYSIVLFDEIDKAHPDVFNILLQVFDDGVLTDAAGRKIDFKNTIIIITANIGAQLSSKYNLGFADTNRDVETKKNFQKALKEFFKPEFINRLDGIVVYKALTPEHIKKILDLYVLEMNFRFKISFTEAAKEHFAKEGYSEEYGARPLRRLLEKEVETRMADLLLDNPDIKEFQVDFVNNVVEVH